jgi:ATP-binding cassette subfamily F protein 3
LLGLVQPDHGRVITGTGVKLGYFDQLLACLPADATLLEAIRPSHKEFVEQQRRNLLARFGIAGDVALQRVDSLSGGERNRAALAMLAASDANVLVLDEPTNHLDLWARDALEQALKQFDGTVLFVSHDRYFVNQVADHLLVFDPQKTWVVAGDYDTYRRLRDQSTDSRAEEVSNDKARRERKSPDSPKEKPKWRFPYRKLADLEQEIADCERRVRELHERLVSPQVLRDGAQVRSCKSELAEVQERLAGLYQHWEEAVQRSQ